MGLASAHDIMHAAFARAVAPRKPLTVSQWAARHRVLSPKGSAEPGPWRNERNPPQVEIMDCASARSPVTDMVALLPIQIGKSEIEMNILGYTMTENPMPIIVALPAEASMNKLIDQKINPLIEETPAVQKVLVSLASRETSNRRTFKDFQGGQLYIEHAGNPVRLKSTSAGMVLADEFSSFASELGTGDDPVALLDGRTTAFIRAKRIKVGTPETAGACRLTELWEKSDQRHYHVPCPDCGHEQPLVWSGLEWTPDARECWYNCRACGYRIREFEKAAIIAAGHWVPTHPDRSLRGYQLNGLYYPPGLGRTWRELAREFLDAVGDPAKLKTFVNDRLAEAWQDASARNLKDTLLRDRAEPYRLRRAPRGVLAITAGVDTQDNRLAVQIVGWGRRMHAWVLDYIELPGNPGEDDVWDALSALLGRPIESATGALMRVEATAIDTGGHHGEDVKHFARSNRLRRTMAIFGARNANAPVLGKPKLVDVTRRGKTDPRGCRLWQVGSTEIKHRLFAWVGSDADKDDIADRRVHLSDELEDGYFGGLLAEIWNPRKGIYEHRRGAPRNEPLDTWVYAYAAAHHPELRLHRLTEAGWDAREAAQRESAAALGTRPDPEPAATATSPGVDSRETSQSSASHPGQPPGDDSRETSARADAAAPGIRNIAMRIVHLSERSPATVLADETLHAWRAASPSTPEETRLYTDLMDALDGPPAPLSSKLPRDLLLRLRQHLTGIPTATDRRRPRYRIGRLNGR